MDTTKKYALGAAVVALLGIGIAGATMRKPKGSSSSSGKLPAPYSDLLVYRGRVVAVWLLSGPQFTNGLEWRYAILSGSKADALAVIKSTTDLVGAQAPPSLLSWGRADQQAQAIAAAKAQIDAMEGVQGHGALTVKQGVQR